ncbi:hypothetical protein ACGFNU_23560 [Spirillospora sp. NPDC048911]|uniref:hypothetical protein n=1 Tax=Spirillospora sp. NPDC048911 TaxID=3364527 RepID=UPI00371270D7
MSSLLAEANSRAYADHQASIAAVRRALARRREVLIASLEHLDLPDPEFTRDINTRAAELSAERELKKVRLAELERTQPTPQCPALLDALPTGVIDLANIPEEKPRHQQDALPDHHHARISLSAARGSEPGPRSAKARA